MTQLSPLEEALFQSWARAHRVEDHNDPENRFDYRGMYKQSNGNIMQSNILQQMAYSHNKATEPQEGGDTTFPDPYMAQAEMHKANLDSQSKNQANQSKMQMEQTKMQHKSSENALDREHDLKKHLVAQQMKQQQAQEQMQQRQQMAQEQGQQRMMMGQQQLQHKSQLQNEQLNHQATQANQDRAQQASLGAQIGPPQATQGGGAAPQTQGGSHMQADPRGQMQPQTPHVPSLEQVMMNRTGNGA